MGFLDEIWWCSGPLGPFDDKVPDVTSCFQYTAILIPVSLLFIMAAAVQYGCCPHCADIASQSIYERLLAEDQIDSSASSVRSHMSRRPSRARFTRLCTSRSRPLWIALGAMCMFPFAEILIRFLLGTLLDGAVYPYVSIITEEFLRSLAYVISAWCLSATSHIPGLVRFFWCAEALATAKEIESGVLRLGTDRDDNMLVVHCLKMLFSIVLVFYAVRPSIVGEGDMLWPGLEEEDEVKTSATNSIREGGHQPWLVSGQGSITGSRPETLTRDVARPRVADSVWDAFLEPSTPPKNTDPEMGDLGGGSDNKTNPSFMAASAVSDGYADSKGSSAPRTPGSSAGRTPQNGRMDLSEVQVSVTTWLLRSKKNSKREEVNYCVLVRVPEAIYERMGAEATTYRIWRSWPRFQLLDRQIRRVTGTQSRHPPFPDRYASRSHHSSADLLEQDRANLDSYMNKLLREPRYWPAVLRFLQKGTEKIARPVGLPFLKPGGLAPQAAAAAPAPLEDSQTPPSEQAAAFADGPSQSSPTQPPRQQRQDEVLQARDRSSSVAGGRTPAVKRFFQQIFSVSISDWAKWEDRTDRSVFIVYTVCVQPRQGSKWFIRRRHEDFEVLRSVMRQRLSAVEVPHIPPAHKHSPGQSFPEHKIERIRAKLEAFIQEVTNASVFYGDELKSFLSPEAKKKPKSQSVGATPPGSLPEASHVLASGEGPQDRKAKTSIGSSHSAEESGWGTLEDIGARFFVGVPLIATPPSAEMAMRVFMGAKGVDWLCENKFARSRAEAVALGNRLMTELQLFDHIDLQHVFRDDRTLLYKLRPRRHGTSSSLGRSFHADDDAGLPSVPESPDLKPSNPLAGAKTPVPELAASAAASGAASDKGSAGPSAGSTRVRGDRKSVDEGSEEPGREIVLTASRTFQSGGAGGTHKFEADIKGYQKSSTDPSAPIFYVIHVREYYSVQHFLDYNIRRRFSDFERFYRRLLAQYKGVPTLPPKINMFQSNEAFLQRRVRGLETFLKRVINTSRFQCHELYEFLAKNQAQQAITLGSQVNVSTLGPVVENKSFSINNPVSDQGSPKRS